VLLHNVQIQFSDLFLGLDLRRVDICGFGGVM
jgi:hypothetical protein